MATTSRKSAVPPGYIQLTDADTPPDGPRLLLPAVGLWVREPDGNPNNSRSVRVYYGECRTNVRESYDEVLRRITEALSR